MARHSVPLALVVATVLMSTVATATQHGSTRLLDVPFLSQSEDLCGGAAMAMVLRYWGDRQILPDDFAPLIDRSASGIHTDVLLTDVMRRGWLAFPLSEVTGANDWMAGQIERGRPIVALIEVRPNRYHYIVIVGWTPTQVIAHDPAATPFTVMPRAEFDRAWAAAGRWAVLVLPAGDLIAVNEPAVELRSAKGELPTTACRGLVRSMVELARKGEVVEAEPGLVAATHLCPDDPEAWRELAGLRFLQKRWGDAAANAERAAALEPSDAAGWDLLATSRFLNEEPDAALGAWNRIARPTVDLIRVEGVRRTRHPVVVGLLNLPPRTLLTEALRGRAARRLAELPSAAQTRLRYRPVAGGLAEIEAVVVERPALPRGLVPLVALASRGLLQRELRVDAAAPTRSGELLTVAWRWWENRPRLAMSLAVPRVSWLPGVTTVEGSWQQQSYARPSMITTDERRHAGVRVADWASSNLRWNAALGFDRWTDNRHLSAAGGVDWRLAGDRVSLGLQASAWTPTGSGRRFATVGMSSAWRSTATRDRPSWLAAVGYEAATSAAPLDLWPGAGTGNARQPLLRAHPLLDEGVIAGEAFGRRLAHGTVEFQRPLLTSAVGSLHLAVFVDSARAWHRLRDDGQSPIHADVGTGVRVTLPGSGGVMRFDVARGVRDKRVVLSAGWQPSWPHTALESSP